MINLLNEGKITIEREILEEAKRSVLMIEDKNVRTKNYASLVAVGAFVKEMNDKGINLSMKDCLGKVHYISEVIDLNSISYRNLQIDIRVVLEGNEVYIPKSHMRNEIIPDIYVAVRLNKSFNYVEFLGYVESDRLPRLSDYKEYYGFSVSELKSFEDLPEVLALKQPLVKDFENDIHNKIKELSVNFFDGKLSRVEKLYLIRHIFYCRQCREKFISFYNLDLISKYLPQNPEVINKHSQLVAVENAITIVPEKIEEEKTNCEIVNDIEMVAIPKNIAQNIYNSIENHEEEIVAEQVADEEFFEKLREDIQKSENSQFLEEVIKKEDDDNIIDELRENSQKKTISQSELERQKSLARGLLDKNTKNINNISGKKPSIASNERFAKYLNNSEESLIEGIIPTKKQVTKQQRKQTAGCFNADNFAEQTSKPKASEKRPSVQIDLDRNPSEGDDIFNEIKQTKGKRTASKLLNFSNSDKKLNKSAKLLTASCLIVSVLLTSGYFIYKHHQHNVALELQKQSNETAMIKANAAATAESMRLGDTQKAMAEGFEDFTSSIDVTNVSWEVLPIYAENQKFVDFLQSSGVTIQSNVQEALLNLSDEYETLGDHVKLAFTFTKDMQINNFRIEETSGSEEIDEIVKDAVLSTLRYFSFPDTGKKTDSIDFKLVIDF